MPESQPERIDRRYMPESLLGEGGMGRVHRALDTRTGEHVALKIIREDRVADPRVRRHFLQEVRAVARLEHPGVVRVLDHGIEPSGRVYFTMELVDGPNLAGAVDACLGWASVRWLSEQLLEILAYAHAREIVHRDLKPENLLVRRRATGMQLKLADFGIARLSEDHESLARVVPVPGSEDVWGTQPGSVLGTPAYISPEQARGLRRRLGPGSDLYAFGILLHELVTGRHPYPAKTATEQLLRHVVAPLAPMATRQGRPVPIALEGLVQQLLRKDVRSRPDCAREVLDMLREVPPFPLLPEDDPERDGEEGLAVLWHGASTGRSVAATTHDAPRHMPTTLTGDSALPELRGTAVDVEAGMSSQGSGVTLAVEPTAGTPTEVGTTIAHAEDRPTRPLPAIAPKEAAGRPGGLALLGIRSPPLVGRQREVKLLRRLAYRAREEGGAHVVCVSGHRGMGKTRLCSWIRADLREQGRFRGPLVALSRYGETDLAEAVRGELVRLMGLDPDDEADAAETLALLSGVGDAQSLAGVARVLIRSPEQESLSGDALRGRVGTLLRGLHAFARGGPALVMLDDRNGGLTTADVRTIEHLVRSGAAGHRPLLVLLAVEDASLAREVLALADKAGARSSELLVLEPIDGAAAARIPAALLPMHESTARAIINHVGGVPADIVEFVHFAARRGLLHLQAGTYWLDAEALRELPAESHAVDLLRLQLEDERALGEVGQRRVRLLALAALHGRRVGLLELRDAVASLMPNARAHVEEDVGYWLERGVLVEGPGDAVDFGSGVGAELARHAAAAEPDFRQWCGWLADRLRKRPALRVGDLASVARLKVVAETGDEEAWILHAARAALVSGHDALARELVDLVRAEHPPADPGRIAYIRGLLAVRARDHDGEDAAVKALAAAEGEEATGRIPRLRGERLMRDGRMDEAVEALDQAVRQWEALSGGVETQAESGREILECRVCLVDALRQRGDYTRAEAELRPALRLAELLEDRPTMASLRGVLAFVLLETARYEESLGEALKALVELDEFAEPWERIDAMKVKAGALLRLGRPEAAIAVAEEALSLAQQLGDHNYRAVMLNLLSMCRLEKGEARRAHALAQEARSLLENGGSAVLRGRVENNLGAAAEALDQQDVALEAYRRAVEVSAEAADAQNEARSRANLARVLADRGSFAEAIDVLDRALALLRSLELPHVEACEALRDDIVRRMAERSGT